MRVRFKDGLDDFEGYEALKGKVFEADSHAGTVVVRTPIGTYTVARNQLDQVADDIPITSEVAPAPKPDTTEDPVGAAAAQADALAAQNRASAGSSESEVGDPPAPAPKPQTRRRPKPKPRAKAA